MGVNKRAAKVSSSFDTSEMGLQAQSQLERLEAANAHLEVLAQCCVPHVQQLRCFNGQTAHKPLASRRASSCWSLLSHLGILSQNVSIRAQSWMQLML